MKNFIILLTILFATFSAFSQCQCGDFSEPLPVQIGQTAPTAKQLKLTTACLIGLLDKPFISLCVEKKDYLDSVITIVLIEGLEGPKGEGKQEEKLYLLLTLPSNRYETFYNEEGEKVKLNIEDTGIITVKISKISIPSKNELPQAVKQVAVNEKIYLESGNLPVISRDEPANRADIPAFIKKQEAAEKAWEEANKKWDATRKKWGVTK